MRLRIAPDATVLQLQKRAVEAYGRSDLRNDGVKLTLLWEFPTTFKRHNPNGDVAPSATVRFLFFIFIHSNNVTRNLVNFILLYSLFILHS